MVTWTKNKVLCTQEQSKSPCLVFCCSVLTVVVGVYKSHCVSSRTLKEYSKRIVMLWSQVVLCLTAVCSANAFLAPSRPRQPTFLRNDGVEQIEFKIYPDGRVEETVRGIKGNNCHQVTEKINEQLGEVVHTRPTEEMYETELVQDQTITQTNGGDSWDGSSTW